MTSRWVGQAMRRREDARLLTGGARFLDDLRPAGLVHAVIVRSPHAHARILRIDAEAARRSPGVLAVLTGAEAAASSRPFPTPLPPLRRVGFQVLATDRVRHVGEPVAVVVAEGRLRAEDALESVVVEYDPLPAIGDVDAARAPGAPRLYEEWPDNVLVRQQAAFGDVEAAFARAEVVVRETVTSQRQTALPLELRGCVAEWDGASLTLWSSTQVPHILRSVLAEVLDVPEPSIRVVTPDVGGGFGVKYQVSREEALVALVARRVRRPVKWREDVREHLSSAAHAREQRVTLEVAARRDGVIEAMRVHAVGDVGTAAAFPPSSGPVMVIAGGCPLGLKVAHFASSFECVVTNKSPAGAYRGFGNPVRVMAVERCMERLAERLGLDPAEVRRRNLLSSRDLPHRGPTGARIESGTLVEAMEQALEMVDYRRRREEQAEGRRRGRYLGIGIASFAEGTGPHFQGLAGLFGAWDACTIRVEPDGRVTALLGVCPQGQGHETTVAQVVADALGVHPEHVTVRSGDTAVSPYGLGTWGSRGAVVAAGSSTQAAQQVGEKLRAIAAHALEAHPGDIVVEDGRVAVAGLPERFLTFRDVARLAYAGRGKLPPGMTPGLEATVFYEPAAIDARPDAAGRAMRYATVANAAHVAVVEVALETGIVSILDYVVVHDCGRIINPTIVDGQIRGGVAQGIAGALHEELVYDEGGQLLTGTLMDYHVPKAHEVPVIRIAHLESPDPTVPGGVKGVGEGGTIGVPAALVNAVADALSPLGVRIAGTPLTPPRLLALIEDARAGVAHANPGQARSER